jgi:serine palmitoyltransferase
VEPTREEEEEEGGGGGAEELWGLVESRPGKFIQIDGTSYLNMATNNYLGLVDEPSLDEEAERCIRKYGVGSCGPRGFYGSVGMNL